MVEYRADVADVRAMLHLEDWETAGIGNGQIERFIDDANVIVEEDLADTDADMSDRRLAKIEAALAGHYLIDSNIDELRQSERTGAADGSFVWFGEQEITSLGKKAIDLDRTGKLRSILLDRPFPKTVRNTDRHVRSSSPLSSGKYGED